MVDVIEELVSEAKKYFVGPYEEDETLHDWPEEIYVSGLLFPKNTKATSEDLESLDSGGGESTDSADESRNAKPWLLQNSIGIRFSLDPKTSEVKASIQYARYEPAQDGGWKRLPRKKELTIPVESGGEKEILGDSDELETKLTWRVDDYKTEREHHKIVSVFLSNELDDIETDKNYKEIRFEEKKRIRNTRIIFQPRIRISIKTSKSNFKTVESNKDSKMLRGEELSLELLFRNKGVYAQGYNCAADWDKTSQKPQHVETVLVPDHQSNYIMMSAEGDDERPSLVDMVEIENAKNPDKVVEILAPTIAKYETWINKLGQKIESSKNEMNEHLHEVAVENYQKCQSTLGRIRYGLSLLKDEKNPDIFAAFMLANRAMVYQRARYDYSIARSKGKKPLTPDPTALNRYHWRPFQIAFILMNMRSLVDKSSNEGKTERETVDLLWFPTGGGKTEAYLGLAAFAMIYRRLRGKNSATGGLGVSVLMRYTLRLLTLQQFERASTLICALEFFRRRDPQRLGSEPFLIGLWVGYSLTPNWFTDSKLALQKLARGEVPESGSPAQLIFCPWCGHDIPIKCYHADDRTRWTIIHCGDPSCEFYHQNSNDLTRALPVLTVDYDIYRRCPSLIISTVDKFARLPWRPETATLFGITRWQCPRHGFYNHQFEHPESRHNDFEKSVTQQCEMLDSPDLIIQDELHLITGPVGTMVGLYETAVDYLSSQRSGNETIRPKIVVSTATISGVEHQIRKLFNRKKVHTFPPPGLEYGDSFFWWESERKGRRYLGLSFSHRSMKFALGRIYASLLQRVWELAEAGTERKKIDPYWTLVGYFNSRRELGGALRLVEDDVPNNIEKMIGIINSHRGMTERNVSYPEELTGQKKGDEIRIIRKNLEAEVGSENAIDVLLATNMISVGIDEGRLGLMVVNGQTKNSSEYIQATGRIGRRENVPGLVLTLYNPYKPRDLSHYEDFVGYHTTLQKSVEPVGLTPFSDRAIERAIHAIFVSMIRLTIENLAGNDDAENPLDDAGINEIQNSILERFCSVQETDKTSDEYVWLERMLTQFRDSWQSFVKECHDRGEHVWYYDDSFYSRFGNVQKKTRVLMIDYANMSASLNKKTFPKPVPGSLRDVETEVGMYYER